MAHPLSSINKLLTVEHFERLVLLFRCFEGRNGNREPLAQEITAAAWQCSRRKKSTSWPIGTISRRRTTQPHRKVLFASSDDHSGLRTGQTYTETESGKTVADFFNALEKGAVAMQGPMGDPLTFSSSLYTTLFSFARDKIKRNAPIGANLLGKMAERFLAGKNPTAFSFPERFGQITEAIRTGQALDFVKPGETTLTREIGAFLSDPKLKQALDRIIAEEPNAQRRSFRMASHTANELTYRLIRAIPAAAQPGQPDRRVPVDHRPAAGRRSASRPIWSPSASRRRTVHCLPTPRAAFTGDGSAAVAQRKAGLVHRHAGGRQRRGAHHPRHGAGGDARPEPTSPSSPRRSKLSITDIPIKNFPPVGEFEIPEYELQKLSFPPFLDMLDYIQREQFTELIISTPGPIGLCALGCAKLLGLRTSGHLSHRFPAVRPLPQRRRLHGNDGLELHAVVLRPDRPRLRELGVLSPLLDRSRHHAGQAAHLSARPRHGTLQPRPARSCILDQARREGAGAALRRPHFEGERPGPSRRNLAAPLREKAGPFTLAIVGEGPYRAELEKLLPGAIFTGILTGRELGVAYASADLFVFPSTTDTFGNVGRGSDGSRFARGRLGYRRPARAGQKFARWAGFFPRATPPRGSPG